MGQGTQAEFALEGRKLLHPTQALASLSPPPPPSPLSRPQFLPPAPAQSCRLSLHLHGLSILPI